MQRKAKATRKKATGRRKKIGPAACRSCGTPFDGVATLRLPTTDLCCACARDVADPCTGCGAAKHEPTSMFCPRPFEHDDGGIR